MSISTFINLLNLYIYRVYFFACYLLAILFSAICFNLMLHYFKTEHYAQVCATAFMTMVFYLAAEAADIIGEIFQEKMQEYRVFLKEP